jgi:sulfoxide reductase catalytic subunit YedY
VTPPKALWSRRRLLVAGVGASLAGAAGLAGWMLRPGSDGEVMAPQQEEAVGNDLYPAARQAEFRDAGRPITDEIAAARYTNFYEFSSTKAVWRYVDAFHPSPWKLEVGGLVARPRVYDMDDLVRAFPLEERIYRHRCVEAWAMVVPWTGFPLAALLRKAQPVGGAKFVRFTTFVDGQMAPRTRSRSYPWPYTEGLTLAEATNELTFLATGMYGHPLLKQHGAPVRLVVPWKYGFKSAKSLVKIEVTAEQPATFWNTLVPGEYDFEANVNPAIPHPRWSHATERMLGTDERYPTKRYNGYGEWVGHLYRT